MGVGCTAAGVGCTAAGVGCTAAGVGCTAAGEGSVVTGSSGTITIIDSWVEVEVVAVATAGDATDERGARRTSGGRAASGSVCVLLVEVGIRVRTA